MIAEGVISITKTQLGVQEKPMGSNWGAGVSKYLKAIGLNFPAFWCMAFVYWCVDQYCITNGLLNPLKKTGGVLDMWNYCKAFATKAKVGSIFIINLGNGRGHTGIVTAIEGNNIITIEGNTNEDGSSNGHGVFARKRSISGITHFIDLPKMITDKNNVADNGERLKKKL